VLNRRSKGKVAAASWLKLVFLLVLLGGWMILPILIVYEIGNELYLKRAYMIVSVCVATMIPFMRGIRIWARVFYPMLMCTILILMYLGTAEENPLLMLGLGLLGLVLGPFSGIGDQEPGVPSRPLKKMTDV